MVVLGRLGAVLEYTGRLAQWVGRKLTDATVVPVLHALRAARTALTADGRVERTADTEAVLGDIVTATAPHLSAAHAKAVGMDRRFRTAEAAADRGRRNGPTKDDKEPR